MFIPEDILIWDYVAFITFIICSMMIPLYIRLTGLNEETKKDYVFAMGNVPISALIISIGRGAFSVQSILGYPSELYYKGSATWETLYGTMLAYPIVAVIFIPVYHGLAFTSVYQYLQMRFNSHLIRCIGSSLYVLRSLLNLGVTVFTPCIALNIVIGLPYWASIHSITVLSIILIIVGGLKEAVMADVVQGITIVICCLMIIIEGFITADGVSNVVNVNYEGGRLGFLNFDPNPSIRVDIILAVIEQLFLSLSTFGCHQRYVQRYCSMKSVREATLALFANVPCIVILSSLPWILGMIIYTHFSNCDPLCSGDIDTIDEILLYYVQKKLAYVPGFFGLFMAMLYNGALSQQISDLSSLATVTWEDFVSWIPPFRDVSDQQQLLGIKIIGVFYGCLSMGIAFGISSESKMIEISMLAISVTSGPLLGLFLIAMLFPFGNFKGALSGMFVSHSVTLWILIGSLTMDQTVERLLPLSTSACNNTSSLSGTTTENPLGANLPYIFECYNYSSVKNALNINLTEEVLDLQNGHESILKEVYSASSMYYCFIGCIITILIGIIISLVTGTTKEDVFHQRLIHPFVFKVSELFPGAPREYLRESEKIQ